MCTAHLRMEPITELGLFDAVQRCFTSCNQELSIDRYLLVGTCVITNEFSGPSDSFFRNLQKLQYDENEHVQEYGTGVAAWCETF